MSFIRRTLQLCPKRTQFFAARHTSLLLVRQYSPLVVRTPQIGAHAYRQSAVARHCNASVQPLRFYAGGYAPPSEAEIQDRVIKVLQNFDKVDGSQVNAKSVFSTDLGLDSLDVVEVVMAIEDEFCVELSDEDAETIVSVESAVAFLKGHPQVKSLFFSSGYNTFI